MCVSSVCRVFCDLQCLEDFYFRLSQYSALLQTTPLVFICPECNFSFPDFHSRHFCLHLELCLRILKGRNFLLIRATIQHTHHFHCRRVITRIAAPPPRRHTRATLTVTLCTPCMALTISPHNARATFFLALTIDCDRTRPWRGVPISV